MCSASNWNALPAEVLRRAFELQQNGLANCAAASTCIAWRDVARISQINHLHLHADTDSQEQFWHRLLAARSSVEVLKLQRTATKLKNGDYYTIQRSDSVAEATINSIPIACRSLTLSEFAAYDLDQYLSKYPDIQQLSIQWNGDQAGCANYHYLPSFAAAYQLTDLTIHMRNDLFPSAFGAVVKSCPNTLQKLMLEGFGSPDEVGEEQPPIMVVNRLDLLGDCVPALTQLELAHSVVTIPGEDITHLSKLQSLSFRESEIYVDGQLEVQLLTNLTFLDLTDTTCYWEDAWVEALDTFDAWPALEVLKMVNCNLCDPRTQGDLSFVQEIHMEYYPGLMKNVTTGQRIFISTTASNSDFLRRLEAELGNAALESVVGVSLELTQQSTQTRGLASLFDSLPNGHALQALEVKPHLLANFHPGSLQLHYPGASLAKLTHLSLNGVHPSAPQLDLRPLTCLTSCSLSVSDVYSQPMHVDTVMLPPSLEALFYDGVDLLLHKVQHNLMLLPALIRVELSINGFFEPNMIDRNGCTIDPQDLCIPQLPVSLRHLVLHTNRLVEAGFECPGLLQQLQQCSRLQHLTLARDQHLTEHLKGWAKTARSLNLVDGEDDEVEGNRLPQVQG